MLKGILNAVANIGKGLDKTIFLKEEDYTKSLIKEMLEIKENCDNQGVIESIEQDVRLIEYGASGERNVIYELKNSFVPMYVIYDLVLIHEAYKAQIDFVIITSKFVLLLETKKLNGNITINSDGDFIRHLKDRRGKTIKKEGMYSPISQNQRHVRIFEDFLKKNNIVQNVPILSLVVIANPKSIIEYKYVKKEVRDQIIKYDQITYTLQELLKRYTVEVMNNNAMIRLGDKLLEAHVESENAFLKKYVEYRVAPESIDSICDNEKNSEEKHIKIEDVVINNSLLNNECGENEKVVRTENIEEIVTSDVLENESLEISEEVIDKLRVSLKEYRLTQSRAENIKAYYIFNNNQMEEIISVLPTCKEALLGCKGFGEKKYEKYGEAIVNIVKEHAFFS